MGKHPDMRISSFAYQDMRNSFFQCVIPIITSFTEKPPNKTYYHGKGTENFLITRFMHRISNVRVYNSTTLKYR